MSRVRKALVRYPVVAGALVGAPAMAAGAASPDESAASREWLPASELPASETVLSVASADSLISDYVEGIQSQKLAPASASRAAAKRSLDAALAPAMTSKAELHTDRSARMVDALAQNGVFLDAVAVDVEVRGFEPVDRSRVLVNVVALTTYDYRKVTGMEPDHWYISELQDHTLVRQKDGSWLIEDVVEYNDESPLAPELPEEVLIEDFEGNPKLEVHPVVEPAPASSEDKSTLYESAIRSGLIDAPADVVAPAGPPYNYTAMLNYTNAYWGPTSANWNSWYRNWGEGSGGGVGGDCTNFISQIMSYGGWDYTDSSNNTYNKYWAWWYKKNYEFWQAGQTYTWAGAENFKQFAFSYRTSAITSFTSLRTADLLQFDQNSNNSVDHSMIVSKDNGGMNKFLSYHSTWDHNEHYKPLTALLSDYPQPGTTYYAHNT